MKFTARGTPSGGTNGILGSVPVLLSSGQHGGGLTGLRRDLPGRLVFVKFCSEGQ